MRRSDLVAPDYTVPDGFIPHRRRQRSTTRAAPTRSRCRRCRPTARRRSTATATHVAGDADEFRGRNGDADRRASAGGVRSRSQSARARPDRGSSRATSGQGIEVEFFPDLVAPGTAFVQGAWFTFDRAPAGGCRPASAGTRSAATRRRGGANVPVTIFQNVGGNFDAPPGDRRDARGHGHADVQPMQATARFDTRSPTAAAARGAYALTRITPNVTCTVGTPPTTNARLRTFGQLVRSRRRRARASSSTSTRTYRCSSHVVHVCARRPGRRCGRPALVYRPGELRRRQSHHDAARCSRRRAAVRSAAEPGTVARCRSAPRR